MDEGSIRAVNIALESYSIVICLILVAYHSCHLDTYKSQKKWLIAMLLSNAGMMIGDLSDWLYNGVEGTWAVIFLRAGMSCFYAFSGILLFCLLGYLLRFMELNTPGAVLVRRIAMAAMAFQVFFSLITIWNGMYFYQAEGNVYVRGSYFWLSQAIPVFLYVLNIIIIWMGRKRVRLGGVLILLTCIFLPASGQVLQIFAYGGAYVNVMTTIAILLVHINIQNEQELAAKKVEKELSDLNIEIMLSQIRPHFLYNALTTIRQLCDTDPQQAKESILDFSRFLRANMNSLTTRELIPFENELIHVRSYLNLEKQRFGRKLQVIYDINAHDFLVPTLTLQPLVENAVRHGIHRRGKGGTVKIYTEEWNDGNVIVVSDDGIGIEAAAEFQEESSHIGIANVQRRLETQCGGTMMIKSDEKGTVVTLWFPKNRRVM